MSRLLLLVTLAGCGRIAFDPVPAAVDDGAQDSIVPYDEPFGPAFTSPELNTAMSDDDISLTDDLLEIYFASDRAGSQQIWFSRRATPSSTWDPPLTVDPVNAGGDTNNPRVTGDGLALYFASARTPSQGGSDVWVSTRPDRASAWSAPVIVADIASTFQDREAWSNLERTAIYWTSNSGGEAELYVAERTSTASNYGARQHLAALSSPAYDGGIWVDRTGLVIMFHSDRASDRKIFRSRRAAITDPFDSPTPITEIDTTSKEEDPWQSPDGHLLVFSSDRTGNFDIYFAAR